MPVASPVISSITNNYEKHFNVNLTDLVTNAVTYTVRFATTAGGSTVQSLIVTNPATASFDMYSALTTLTLGTTYYVSVVAQDASSTILGTSSEVTFNYVASAMKPDALFAINNIDVTSFVVTISAQETPTMPTPTSSIIIYASNGTTVVRTLNGPYSVGQNVLIDNLNPGDTYNVKVTTTNTNGSRTSANTSVLMNPAPPIDIFATVNKRQVNITWTPNGVVTSYKLYISTGPNQANAVTYTISSGATTNITLTLTSDGDFYASMQALTGTGRGAKTSAYSGDTYFSISTIPRGHMKSTLSTIGKIIPVDNNTIFLAHYDITPNDVLQGIAPTTNIATLRPFEGKFGGGIAIEEGTTNLLAGTSNMTTSPWTVSNGWTTAPASVVRTLDYGREGNLDATKYVVVSGGDGFTYQSTNVSGATTGLKFTSSWWVRGSGIIKINHAEVGGTVGARDSGYSPAITLTNDWRRISFTAALVDNDRTQIQARLRGSGNITMYVWQPQLELKPYPTSFTTVARSDGQLSYPLSTLNMNPVEGTLSFWAKLPYSLPYTSSAYMYLYMSTSSGYGGGQSLNFWAQNNGYPTRIIGCHWGSTDGATNHIPLDTTQITNYNNGGWNMYAITWKNPNGYKIYINGELAGSAASGKTLMPFSSSTLDIKGMLLDELRVDSVERSAEEIEGWFISNTPFFPRGVYTIAY